MQVAQRIHSLAQEQNNPSLMMGACLALAGTHSRQGDFETARHYAARGIDLWRSRDLKYQLEVGVPVGQLPVLRSSFRVAFRRGFLVEGKHRRSDLASRDIQRVVAMPVALFWATILGHFERDPAEVERRSSHLIELACSSRRGRSDRQLTLVRNASEDGILSAPFEGELILIS
jgi:hypothetical protein